MSTTPSPFRVACLQLTTGPEVARNLEMIRALALEARELGADLVTTPECSSFMEPRRRAVLEKARPEDEDPGLAGFRDIARETGRWVLAGSLIVRVADERCANRSYLIDSEGTIVARYDKIHMFDVDLEGGESYRESRTYRPGTRAVVAPSPWGGVGLTVCYDMRFPHLYRTLAQAGARYLTVPSAFTRPTGRAHWHVLLRARAIETGCFVFAPAQCGEHAGGRRTYGHSLVVDPWGEVLADGGESPGVTVAEVDPARVEEVRRMVPSLAHDRPFEPPAGSGEPGAGAGGTGEAPDGGS